MITVAPRAAKCCAAARPRPAVAPVMRTVFSSKSSWTGEGRWVEFVPEATMECVDHTVCVLFCGMVGRCWEVLGGTGSDFLSLNRTGRIREAFLTELSRHEDFRLSASGSRVQYGNYEYLLETEQMVAAFHNAETSWIAHSGFFANVGVLEAIPLPGDVIVYDELSHASTMLGMKTSVAARKVAFQHNSVDSLSEVLVALKDGESGFATGAQSVLICVESMEMVGLVKELFPAGNAQFLIDEAHSSGVLGPRGGGLLGLEKEIAIRVHVCSKALASTGGEVILCNKTRRTSFPMVASIRAGYQLLMSGATEEAQAAIQEIVKYFFQAITADPVCEQAMDEGLLTIPLAEDWQNRAVHSHIVPITTRPRHEQFLAFHLALANMNAYSISYPVVPKGGSRVRLVLHVHNTKHEIDYLVAAISKWASEMLEIEEREVRNALPAAAREVYALQTSLAV
ncbi:pyridoxal phosphate-dependent transferase [Aspergillus spectabilis]